jgi:methionyl-tRNA formyltransferase
MYMDEGLDTGDMLLQRRIAILPNETGGSLHDRLGEIAPAALAAALKQLAEATASRIPQNGSEATYAPKLEREHGQIDWNEPATAIERKIRAYNPWPAAYTLVRDETRRERKLKIFSARVVKSGIANPPGEIATHGSNQLAIGASDGALLLAEVQLEGKKRMSAEEFARGFKGLFA